MARLWGRGSSRTCRPGSSDFSQAKLDTISLRSTRRRACRPELRFESELRANLMARQEDRDLRRSHALVQRQPIDGANRPAAMRAAAFRCDH